MEQWELGEMLIDGVRVPHSNFCTSDTFWPVSSLGLQLERPSLTTFITTRSFLVWKVRSLHETAYTTPAPDFTSTLTMPDSYSHYIPIQVMKKNHTHLAWLTMPVQQWKKDINYRELEEVVTKLCVVNDPVERSVKAAGDRIRIVRSDKAFQATLLTLEELCRLSSSPTKQY